MVNVLLSDEQRSSVSSMRPQRPRPATLPGWLEAGISAYNGYGRGYAAAEALRAPEADVLALHACAKVVRGF
jgi:hypothetical protein